MKIDRRCFLSLGIGAAAGITLSPLPWKITDDLSIWTQNWPWTPVPPDGKTINKKSACQLCPGGCGIAVRRIDKRVVKIEGLKGHPVNDGGLCTLGLSAAQLLYSPFRIQAPVKKVNGKWRKISWDDALATITTKMTELREEGKAHTVAGIIGGERGTVSMLWQRLFKAYGSPNLMRNTSMEDAYSLVLQKTQGNRVLPGFDFENADFVLSFGSGLIDGWGSPVRMFRALGDMKNRQAKFVQVEPRLSNTAAKADQWLPIIPGTEALLALGLIHVILSESLYQVRFVEQHCEGFDNFKKMVLETYPPEQVAKATGIKVETIKELGREFARAKNPLAVCGRGQGLTPGSFQETAAVHVLNALTGNLGEKGGVLAMPAGPEYEEWPEVEPDDVAAEALQQKRLDGAGGDEFPDAGDLPTRLAQVINTGKGDGIQLLFISGANPVYTLPDTKAVQKALAAIPFKVSFATHMDESAEMADLILPNHCFLERYEDVPVAAGLTSPIVNLAVPVVKPMYNTKHVGDSIIAIAQALGDEIADAFSWENYKTCLKETLGDEKWEKLTEEGYWVDEEFKPVPWKEGFKSAATKFIFPDPARLNHPPVSASGDAKQFPLTLIACDSMRLAGGAVGSPPFLIKITPDSVLLKEDLVVEINPATAADLGLKEGAQAVLATPKGSGRVRVHLDHGIRPGLVAMARGLGHGAHDKYLAGKGLNTNAFIGPVDDPDSGYDAAWGISASLAKA